MKKIIRENLLGEMANLLGLKKDSPNGDLSAYDDSLNEGIRFCWVYRNWSFSIKRGKLIVENDIAYMPEDYSPDAFFKIPGYTANSVLDDDPTVYLEFDSATGRYIVRGVTTEETVIYQTSAPIDKDVFYFPSSYVMALAGAIIQKQKDSPNSADISQEWNLLLTNLDQLSGKAEINMPSVAIPPTRRAKNKYDVQGGYTGNVG